MKEQNEHECTSELIIEGIRLILRSICICSIVLIEHQCLLFLYLSSQHQEASDQLSVLNKKIDTICEKLEVTK